MEDDTYEVPLTGQKYFGAGIIRKRVPFVPSSTPNSLTQDDAVHTELRGRYVKDAYLSIVLNSESQKSSKNIAISQAECQAEALNDLVGPVQLRKESSLWDNKVERGRDDKGLITATQLGTCAVCNLPITKHAQSNLDPHESYNSSQDATSYEPGISNQLCARHSHPPSSIDRRRKGLAILQKYGWDPDAGRGLGASESGRLHPIKAKLKNDSTGIGAKHEAPNLKPKEQKLDAGKVVKREKEERKKTERWREIFYGRDDLEKYLGPMEPP